MSGNLILQNIRILDFSWVLAGPFATRMMADYGAEVIKVQPLTPEADDAFSQGYFKTWNRNKLSISLNMGKPEGREIASKLASQSDAVVENFSPRVMENWGLDYAGLVKVKPDIILLSMSVMGHSGPWRDYSGFGPAVQAFSGLSYLTAYPGGEPVGMGYSYADHVAGLYAGIALLGALEYRRRTGQGQFIDLSQTETMTSLLADAILEYTREGCEPRATGNRSTEAAPQGVYPCAGKDEWCAISVCTEEQWAGLKRAADSPDWMDEERFADLSSRLKNIDELDNLVGNWTRCYTAEEVMARLQKEGVPAGVARDAKGLVNDPQLRSRGFFLEMDHPETGKTMMEASPIRLSGTPAEYRRPAPLQGQDNEYVYGQILGLGKGEIERLKRERVIGE